MREKAKSPELSHKTAYPPNLQDPMSETGVDQSEWKQEESVDIADNEASSSTKINDVPLEMLDIILQKSYLHWILKSATKQRNEEDIKSLISVDVCFYRRMNKLRFKKAIWRYLKGFYEERYKHAAILRNNRRFLLKTLEPSDEFIYSLFRLDCITETQHHFIQRQCSKRDKNFEILTLLSCLDYDRLSKFANCLRDTNQATVEKIILNGGVVLQVKVRDCGVASSIDPKVLHQRIGDIRDRTKLRSHQIDQVISQLKEEGIEIQGCQLDRRQLIVWISCASQSALEYMRKLYQSNQLMEIFLRLANVQSSTSKLLKSKKITIDCQQFMKIVVVRPVSVKFTQRIATSTKGVAKLQNRIYVLSEVLSRVFLVYEDRDPFRLQETIDLQSIRSPIDFGSCEKKNCLFVFDTFMKCVWKVTRETNGKHETTKWLTTKYRPLAMSVSSDGQLLVVSDAVLVLYGSDAELIRCIELQNHILTPIHAVETSAGNFIILHSWKEEDGKSWENGVTQWGIYELSADGQMVIHRFTASNKTQELRNPCYLSIDLDDRLFVADGYNGRVILLDFNLKWNRILCPTKEEPEEAKIRWPGKLCYDEKRKQLIVTGHFKYVNVYTLG